MNETTEKELQLQYRQSNDYHKYVDWAYFDELLVGTLKDSALFDEDISTCAKLPVAEINPIELALLRLASFELKYCLEVPVPVILDEYVTIAKEFAAEDAHQFINAILDKLAKKLRKV